MTNLAAVLLLMTSSAVAQEYLGPAGTPVDRNVADTGPNAASQRISQPGLGQFGVGSLLLDRYDNKPHEFDRFNPLVGDPRVNHRYIMQAPGVTALMKRPDYIGPSPHGGWVYNQQTFDGAEILTYSPDTVFVLSPELLKAPAPRQTADPHLNNPNLIQPRIVGDPHAIMRDARVTGQRVIPAPPIAPQLQHDPNYVHPAIIERRRKLKAEREAEAAKQQLAAQETATAAEDDKTE